MSTFEIWWALTAGWSYPLMRLAQRWSTSTWYDSGLYEIQPPGAWSVAWLPALVAVLGLLGAGRLRLTRAGHLALVLGVVAAGAVAQGALIPYVAHYGCGNGALKAVGSDHLAVSVVTVASAAGVALRGQLFAPVGKIPRTAWLTLGLACLLLLPVWLSLWHAQLVHPMIWEQQSLGVWVHDDPLLEVQGRVRWLWLGLR